MAPDLRSFSNFSRWRSKASAFSSIGSGEKNSRGYRMEIQWRSRAVCILSLTKIFPGMVSLHLGRIRLIMRIASGEASITQRLSSRRVALPTGVLFSRFWLMVVIYLWDEI